MLNGAGSGELRTFEEFKKECLSFWRLMGKEDKLVNICNFISTPREGDEFLNLYTQVRNNWEQVRRDIINSPLIPTPPDADGDPVVRVDHMLNYMSFGILYKYSTDEEHRTLKTLMLNPTEYLGVLVG